MNVNRIYIPYIYGAIAAASTILLDAFLIYLFSGVFTYTQINILDIISWLLSTYPFELTAYSINTGIIIGLTTYTRISSKKSGAANKLGITGIIISAGSSVLFACCAPFIVSLIAIIGSTALLLITYSRIIFIVGVGIQLIAITILATNIMDNKEKCEC